MIDARLNTEVAFLRRRVAELKALEAERKRTEQRVSMLAQALKSIGECVSITDIDDIVLYVNDAFLQTYGFREEDLLGKPIDVVRSPNNPPEVTKDIVPATLIELIDSFLETAPPLLARLNQGVITGNAADVRAAAHTIKSSSKDFGATLLAELCQELEDMGKAGALAGAAELAARVEVEYGRVAVALQGERAA